VGDPLCTREDIKSALDSKDTARNNAQIDRANASATDAVEGLLHRSFVPWTGTRYFRWPNTQRSRSWRLRLNADELISITALTAGGVTIASTDYFLEPANDGPPYTSIELDLSSSATFGGGSTHQRNIAVTGVFGYSATEDTAGALAEALDSSETGVDVTGAAAVAIGVGSILKVDSERMIVTERGWLTTSQTVQTSALTALANNVTVNVTTGSAYVTGEVILIDSEKMLIVDIAGNALTVKRAWDGSVLAAHNTGVTIYGARTLTVTRGALGTTAAAHDTAAAITKHVVPGLVRDLAIAEAVVRLQQEGAAYARVVGSGDNQRESSGRGLKDIRDAAYAAYGRKARHRAV
jgi:hypothetical protein